MTLIRQKSYLDLRVEFESICGAGLEFTFGKSDLHLVDDVYAVAVGTLALVLVCAHEVGAIQHPLTIVVEPSQLSAREIVERQTERGSFCRDGCADDDVGVGCHR